MVLGTSGGWISGPSGDGTETDLDEGDTLASTPSVLPPERDNWLRPGPTTNLPTCGPNGIRYVEPEGYELPLDRSLREYYRQWNRPKAVSSPSEETPEPAEQEFNLENVLSLDRVSEVFGLTDEQLAFLEENYMVGTAHPDRDYAYFADAYEYLSEGVHTPLFITSDSVVDALHLVFEDVLINLEETELTEHAVTLSKRMADLSRLQMNALPEEGRYLAESNMVFFAAALRMLDPDAIISADVEEEVDAIIQLVEAAAGTYPIPGFETTPGMLHVEDFTQYKPRGHYTQSEELERYFRALMWYGRITFRGDSLLETQRAVLAALAMYTDAVARDSYFYLTSAIDYLVGPPDDLNFIEYAEAVGASVGRVDADYSQILDEDLMQEFQEYIKDLRPPRIQSGVSPAGQPEYGLRIVGQRMVWDSYVFTQCTFDRLENRFVPTVLDVMSVLGSDEALGREVMEPYPGLEDRLADLRNETEALPDRIFDDTAYWGWLHSLQALHEEAEGDAVPEFMGTDAWDAKQLNAQAGSWTQLTHDTCLYRKQSSCGVTCLPEMSWFVYVEPVPELYARVGRLVDNMVDRLTELDMISDSTMTRLGSFTRLLDTLESAAEDELDGSEPSKEVMRDLRGYDAWLKVLYSEKPKTVVVSDVHTDPNTNTCLQEGVGLRFIVVIAPYGDGHVATVGVVFQHYEFIRSLDEGRLTDEEWSTMLEDGTAPEPAPWAQDFIL